jgi:hypothetical protein
MEDKISSQRVLFSRLLSQPGLGKRTLWKRSGDILVFNVPEIVSSASSRPFFTRRPILEAGDELPATPSSASP